MLYDEYNWSFWRWESDYDDCFIINGSHIGFEDFKIRRENILDVTYYYAPGDLPYTGMFFKFSNADNSWLSGIDSRKACRHHVYVYNSHNIEIRGCYMRKSEDYGGNGHGYGIQLYGPNTQYCLIENNIFGKQRHAYVLGDEAQYNVFGYNFQRDGYEYEVTWNGITLDHMVEGQICIHGGGPNYTGPSNNLC